MGGAPLERTALNLRLLFALAVLALPCRQYAAGASSESPSATGQGATAASPSVLLVVGAPGESSFSEVFEREVNLWQAACQQSSNRLLVIGPCKLAQTNQAEDHALLEKTLALEPKDGAAPFWLVLVGHGTFEGKEAKFNLRGPDVSASELAGWLKPFHRPMAIIDTSSSSAPFLNALSGPNRVVVTATRSGNEKNFTRFGIYLADSLANPEADLDKDGQVSLLEAFLIASRKTTEFYKTEGRIQTEHALLDDNGDGLGTQADWFHGLRAVKAAKEKAQVDGAYARQFVLVPSASERKLTANQRARRDALETTIAQLRQKKDTMKEDDYYQKLEPLLLELAKIYREPTGR